MSDISLHLGAHRTGTTYLQDALAQNSAVLERAGITVHVPWKPGARDEKGLRQAARLVGKVANARGLRRYFKRREARSFLQNLCAQSRHPQLLLSDENFLGKPFDIETGEALYAKAVPHLQALAGSLPQAPKAIHVTMRNYADFLPSAYAMIASRVPGTVPFSKVTLTRGWPDLLRKTQATFPAAHLTFSVYEDTGPTGVLAALLPAPVVEQLLLPQTKINVSPTLEAIEAAQKLSKLSSTAADSLVALHQDGTPFQPLDQEAKDQLSAIYDKDLSLLRSEFQEVSNGGPA